MTARDVTTIARRARDAAALAILLIGCVPRPASSEARAPGPVSSPVLPRSASALSADGRLYVRDIPAAGEHPPLAVVDLERAVPLGEFVEHAAVQPDTFDLALALAPTGEAVASLRGRADEILVWDPRTRTRTGRVRTAGERVVGLAFAADGRSLMIATPRRLERRALPDGQLAGAWEVAGVRAFAGVPGRADAWLIAVERPDAAHFALLREDRPQPRRLRIPGLRGVEQVVVSGDGRWLAAAAWGRDAAESLQVWDLASRRKLVGADEPVNAIAFSEDGRFVVASLGAPCVGDGRSHLVAWDLEDARVVADLPLAPATALRVVGREVVAGMGGEVVRVDLDSGARTTVLQMPCEPQCGPLPCA